jgi:hypothetical protein
MVDVTEAPRNKAPENSKIAAQTTACFKVRDLDETEDAKALATSLAPMRKA